jgi:hypothetical protein
MTEIETLRASLPPIFARSEIGKLTGGIIQPGTMRNRDSRGDGIENRFQVGRKVCYSREDFLQWLSARVTRQGISSSTTI